MGEHTGQRLIHHHLRAYFREQRRPAHLFRAGPSPGTTIPAPRRASWPSPLSAPTQPPPRWPKPSPTRGAIIRESFSYQFPDDSFTDPDPGDTLSYAATRGDGSALPAWLTFDPATRTFSGTPQAANAGTLTVKVTAKDSIDNTVSDSFDITVVAADAFVAFRRSDYESAEGARLVMRLRLSKSVPAKVDVYITSQDGTATKDDYAAGAETAPDGATNVYKVTFPANTTEAVLFISLTDDTIFEPRESFSLRIHSIDSKAVIGFGSRRESVVGIQGNDHIILSPNAVTVTEAPGARAHAGLHREAGRKARGQRGCVDSGALQRGHGQHR